jgi:hypothetical protein
VKDDAVVIADVRQPDHVLAMAGRDVGFQIEHDLAHRRVELDLVVVLREVNVLNGGVYFGFAVLGHGIFPCCEFLVVSSWVPSGILRTGWRQFQAGCHSMGNDTSRRVQPAGFVIVRSRRRRVF